MVGVLNVKGHPRKLMEKVGIGFSEKVLERTESRVMAEDSKFSAQQQVEMLNTLMRQLSPEVLHVAANALEAKEQFVMVFNVRQCHECGELNLPKNVVDGKCKKCQ